MNRDTELATMLSDFAHTLVTDFPIQGILDELVHRIVGLLEVSSAGVTLISPGRVPHYVAASDPSARRYEELQTELDEGPCLEAYRAGRPVAIADLAAEQRYPRFAPAALDAGLRAVFTFPLCHQDRRIGALDLYRDAPGQLDPWALKTAQTLAQVTTVYLLNAQARALARETTDRYRQRSLHDPLTGLPNRALLQERLEHAAARGRRSGADVAVLFVDLDRFKWVNDDHGHQAGDFLLTAVADRLSHLLRPADTLARLAGDEFVVLCEDLAAPSDAVQLAQRIGDAFLKPFILPSMSLTITASVGIAFAGHGQYLPGQLMRDADAAMYQAKRLGGDRHRVNDVSAELTPFDSDLRVDLRDALDAEALEIYYQPVMASGDGQVAGAEALLRWPHPTRGIIDTANLVAIAEEIGLLGEIGAWVLERACAQRQAWLAVAGSGRNDRGEPLHIAVNVSSTQLMAYGFLQVVEGVLQRTGLDPAALVLEITEGILLGDGERAATVLDELRALGVRIALDDFGSGYSSLQYLQILPVDIVKIDQGFVAELGRDPAATAIVTAVADLSHELGLSVVAEGVETQAQRDAVTAIGCEYFQGYLAAPPMPADQFEALLVGEAPAGQPAEPSRLEAVIGPRRSNSRSGPAGATLGG
ncbi:MAG: EAL domain-containing protein [Nocardioidaceae bacterium]|nr:EAL domain-containing protein [Nocardioidaceae bacterium]MBA3799711.1 EAL domain-containing protein [Geodermatophilaceae bacterium]